MTLLDLTLPYQRAVILDKAKVKVLNFSRQIGKSWTAAFLSSMKCCQKKNALVIYLSTGQRAANEALKTCLKFADSVKVLSGGEIGYTSSATCITFTNGSRIMSLPGSPNSCRGWSADLLVCDEMAFWQQPDECWQAIVPTTLNQLSGGDKQIVICSTPLGRNSLFYDLCQRAKNEADWSYFQTTIHDAIADGLKVDLDALHKLIPDPYQFAQEFECQFAESVNQLVSISDLVFVTPSADEKFVDYFMGADWARTSDGTSIVVIGRRKDGTMRLVDLLNLHNTEYHKQIEVAKQMFNKYKPKLFYGDATGLGHPIMEQLNRECSARIKPFVFNHQNKNQSYEYFRKSVFDRKIEFDSKWRDEIVEDLLLVQQTITDDGKVVYVARRGNGSHADNMSAIILALQAERECRQSLGAISAVPYQTVFGARTNYFG